MDESLLEIEPLVPANRLGQLLAEARLREGTDLEELATISDFTVGDLSDLEAGHRLLDDNLIKRVTKLYEIDCGPIVPERSGLVIDLNHGTLSAANHAYPLESSERDHVLERYLSLVYLLRNNPPGNDVVLRDEDVDILAASLAERRELIEEQLLRSMRPGNQAVESLFQRLKNRLWVPAAGAIVGATTVGVLVIVTSPTTSQTASTEALLSTNGLPDNDPTTSNPERSTLAGASAQSDQAIGASTASVPSTAAGAGTIPFEERIAPATSVAPRPARAVVSTTTPAVTSSAAAQEVETVELETVEIGEPATSTTSIETSTTSIEPTPPTAARNVVTPSTTNALGARPASVIASEAQPEPAASVLIGQQAEDLLPFDWEEVIPGWEINYRGHNQGFRGLTYPFEDTIEIFVREDDSPELVASILAHEIGHAIDVTYLQGSDRDAWLEVRGIEGAPWWADAYASDFQSGAGDFAEAFAVWAVGDRSSSEIAGQPTQAQLDVLLGFLDGVL